MPCLGISGFRKGKKKMSLVVVILFGIMLFNMIRGYKRGVLLVVYSIVAWGVILIAANGLAPKVKEFMVNHTGIYQSIEQSCEKSINDRLSESVDNSLDASREYTVGTLQKQGIYLPKQMVDQMESNMAQTGDKIVQESGIGQYIAEYITQFILTGISYFLTMVILSILFGIIKRVISVANQVPVLGGVNKFLGLLLGLVQGVMVVCIILYFVSLISTTGLGNWFYRQIQVNPVLLGLYNANPIVVFLLYIFNSWIV